MQYAQVEFNVPQQARIIGIADLEIRSLLRPELPVVPREFAKRWRPETLSSRPSELGPLLRQARLRKGLSFREASAISREMAKELGDPSYFTAAGSLSDYESGDTPPRHLHKVITFCVVYSLDFQTTLQSLGMSSLDAGQEPIPQVLTGETVSIPSETSSEADEALRVGFLGNLLDEFGEVPFFLRGSLQVLSGLRNPSLKDCFWIGGARESHPYLAGGILALVNRQKKKPNGCGSKPMWQQPLYVVLKRNGTYSCGCCSRENNSLVVHTYPGGVHRRDQFRNRDVEVVGKIGVVVRKLI
jgi:transcriptional regulator with XRE-family HTH domain